MNTEGQPAVHIERLLDAPIITPGTHPSIGTNIQGPSMIRVPNWIDSPLGKYYLYFADHKGSYIRLAYADRLLSAVTRTHIQPDGKRTISRDSNSHPAGW